jgi:predicted nucleotidyltransferase
MSTYKISFKQLRQDNLKNTFASFEKAFQKLNIEVYLIGALARDTWFAEKGIRALGTKDIDFAVLIPDKYKFDELKNYLVKEEEFTETKNEFTLLDTKGYQIDLLPFGFLNIEGRKITDKEGRIHTNVSGFQEVYDEATEIVAFDGEFYFKVSSLAGIVVLKLIAWDDRPEMRSQDIRDISLIIQHYFQLEEDLIYNHHSDLFNNENYDLTMLAARALGREMASILNRNELLKQRILHILNINSASINKSIIAILFEKESGSTVAQQYEVLKELIKGIEEYIQ